MGLLRAVRRTFRLLRLARGAARTHPPRPAADRGPSGIAGHPRLHSPRVAHDVRSRPGSRRANPDKTGQPGEPSGSLPADDPQSPRRPGALVAVPPVLNSPLAPDRIAVTTIQVRPLPPGRPSASPSPLASMLHSPSTLVREITARAAAPCAQLRRPADNSKNGWLAYDGRLLAYSCAIRQITARSVERRRSRAR